MTDNTLPEAAADPRTNQDAVPEGFSRVLSKDGPFVELVGPLYRKPMLEPDDPGFIYGMRIEAKHANGVGTAHGGLLLTLADTALGDVLAAHYGRDANAVTVSLSSDFAGPVRVGDWVEAHVDVQRIGGRLCYGNSYLVVDGVRVFRASGVFTMWTQKDR